jgi:Na+/H+ antiporter NhaD/arsenite permease-like protein
VDPVVFKIATLAIFMTCYALVISRKIRIAYVALVSALLLLVLLIPSGTMTTQQAYDSIRWDVLGIYWGFLMLSIVFAKSGVPAHLAKHVLHRTKNEGMALLSLCAITAFLSSFLENVGVVLIMAPIAIEAAKKTKSSLFHYLIPIAISANMVTTVSMVADPTAMILASESGMNFMDFYWFHGRLGLGIISIIGVVVGLAVLYYLNFRKMDKKITIEEEKIKMDYAPSALFIGGVLALAFNSYIGVRPGLIGLAIGIISLVLGRKVLREVIVDFDWNSFAFIFGIFIIIGAVQAVGILQDFSSVLLRIGLNNPALTLAIITWFSVALSSFMDNVPYTVLMIPVCTSLAASMGMTNAFPFLYGMIIGTGIGGNITPVGATANVFACGMLEKRGHKIKLKEYLKISVPVSVISVLVAYLSVQLLWM